MGDRIAFRWLKPKTSSLIIPDSFMDRKLGAGKYYIGVILAIGNKVKESLSVGDKFIFNEYGVDGFGKFSSEDELYFIPSKEIKVLIEDTDIVFRDDSAINAEVNKLDNTIAESDNQIDL